MLHAAVLERLEKKCPVAVMVRAILEQSLSPDFIDEVFERVASRQYTRSLLFSTLVRLLSLVVCRVRPSVNAAMQFCEDELTVRPKSVYNKLNGTELPVAEALLAESAAKMTAVVEELGSLLPPLVPGYRTRILDGNHLAATEHRIRPLRTLGGGALPGQALVVFDANMGLISRTYLCEDGHSQERDIVLELLGQIQSGELWIADRNFATSVFMWQMHSSKGFFILRRHAANGRVRETSPWRVVGESDTGSIEERDIVIEDGFDQSFPARAIRVRLKTATRDGDREIELLTNLPSTVSAVTIAAAYRGRWRIETAFADLDRVFEGEIATLGHPRAALLAFSLALIAYNTLAVFQAALRKTHGAEKVQNEVSTYYIGLSASSSWSAMEIFVEPEVWTERYSALTPRQLASTLVRLAKGVSLAQLRKHRRGPKKPRPARTTDKHSPHFSTARVLKRHQEAKKSGRKAKTNS